MTSANQDQIETDPHFCMLAIRNSSSKRVTRGHQPITGLHFVDWHLICILGHAHYLCHAQIMVRVMVRARVRVSCHVTCADSAKICCISNIWSVCKNNLIQQNLLCQQKCMAMTRQKMLYKQIFAVSAKISWFSRNTLCQQTCCWVSKLPGDVTTKDAE